MKNSISSVAWTLNPKCTPIHGRCLVQITVKNKNTILFTRSSMNVLGQLDISKIIRISWSGSSNEPVEAPIPCWWWKLNGKTLQHAKHLGTPKTESFWHSCQYSSWSIWQLTGIQQHISSCMRNRHSFEQNGHSLFIGNFEHSLVEQCIKASYYWYYGWTT